MKKTETICDRCGAVCDGVSSLKAEVCHSGFNLQALWKFFTKAKDASVWDLCLNCATSLEAWRRDGEVRIKGCKCNSTAIWEIPGICHAWVDPSDGSLDCKNCGHEASCHTAPQTRGEDGR